jgi:hypothetical protein
MERKVPVVLIIYNRAHLFERVLEAVRSYQPSHLFVIADGPRTQLDWEKVSATRRVLDQINWPCTVYKNFSQVNLGCRKRVISGLSWVFSLIDKAIIIEDDVVVDPTFFGYCEQLLHRYQLDPTVLMISGMNGFPSLVPTKTPGSYFRSKTCGVWGWATWKRSWELYDEYLTSWPSFEKTATLESYFGCIEKSQWWRKKFSDVWKGFGTWDWQLTYCMVRNNMVSIVPVNNLARNIGFEGERYEVTNDYMNFIKNLQLSPLDMPLKHLCFDSANAEHDDKCFRLMKDYH